MRLHLTSISIRTSKRLCHYNKIGCRSITTSHSVYDDKKDIISSPPEGTITSLRDLADVDINQVALEAGSNSGLAFIGNNIMGAFNWVSGWLPSFGKSEVVWNDMVVPKLTHLYIPSLYEFIQYHSGVPWFVVIGAGTLTLRTLLLPLTRRTLRMQTLTRDFIPKYQSYGEYAKVLQLNKQKDKVEKVKKWQKDLALESKSGSTMVSFVASGLVMFSINRGLHHLARLTPLLEGGFGPFLDMTVNSNASVGLYCLPICVVTALCTTFHMNLRREKWYNPRVYLIIVPVGGIFAYFISKMSVAMCLHYALSSWYTAGLAITQQTNHKLLKLPPPYRAPPPAEPIKLSRKTVHAETVSLPTEVEEPTDVESEDLSEISPKVFQAHYEKTDLQLLEELTGKQSEHIPRRASSFNTPYTPVFKLGEQEEEPAEERGAAGENIPPPPPPPGALKRIVGAAPKFQFRKRFRAWYFRQKLMRHGKKGNMSLFLEDAPQEMNFLQEPVELTTKVTPGLKKYVLRRQYPMNTLEEMERKVSYIERVQNQRW